MKRQTLFALVKCCAGIAFIAVALAFAVSQLDLTGGLAGALPYVVMLACPAVHLLVIHRHQHAGCNHGAAPKHDAR
ncbi:DUF2933 domain-containing protein [Falsiroseomonas sp. HW251]|uniref:DUF2933 domain-containing protein n=1 Tax=Falsiroseomonas sp. HW251 TaxID=3390998 RepID=UPI003D31E7EC